MLILSPTLVSWDIAFLMVEVVQLRMVPQTRQAFETTTLELSVCLAVACCPAGALLCLCLVCGNFGDGSFGLLLPGAHNEKERLT